MKGTPIDIYVIPKDVKLAGSIDKNGFIKLVEDNGLYHSTMISIPDGMGTVTTIKNQKFSNPDIMTIVQEDKPYLLSTDCTGLRFSIDSEYKRERVTFVIDREKDRIICISYIREYEYDASDIQYINNERCHAAVMMRIDDPHSIIGTPFSTLLPLAEKYKYAVVFADKIRDAARQQSLRVASNGCDVFLFDGDNELTFRRGTITTDNASRKNYLILNDE